ncbi:MAG: medium chain dehydrogenase/reductase family protein [Kibdelosporangium sp.]
MPNARTQVLLPGIVEPEGLEIHREPIPEPRPGQALVAVEATGVSFAEQQMRRGRYYDQPPFPFVPGYDLVGRVEKVGSGVEVVRPGSRVAALTKVGAWSSHVVLDAADLVAVPDGMESADAETVVVNGITAWQMLHRKAKVRKGDTILVHGANGGVGTTLVQLAKDAGVKVIGTASARHHDRLRELGVEPIDYRTEDVFAQVRRLAPAGVNAVFDHVGGRSVVNSWQVLARGGTLVSYGSASTRDDSGSKQLPVLSILARTSLWNLLPNGKHAYFYNIWAGRRFAAKGFRARLAEDLTAVLRALRDGRITAQLAAKFPLTQAAEAVRLAESGTVTGKVVLIP